MAFRRIFVVLIFALSCFFSVMVFGQDAESYFKRGNELYNAKKYQEAVSSYIRAIQLAPRSQVKAYLNCARAYQMIGKFSESKAYYEFYLNSGAEIKDAKKVRGEYQAVSRKVKKGTAEFTVNASQANVLKKLKEIIASGGPFLTADKGGGLAYYDVLIRTEYAFPDLAVIQGQLVNGLISEVLRDIHPAEQQVMPSLDRGGWEMIRSKLSRLEEFGDISYDKQLVKQLEDVALGWESYYRGDYASSDSYFRNVLDMNSKILAAYWGYVMVGFHVERSSAMMDRVMRCEAGYKGVSGVERYFMVLKAKVSRDAGDIDASLGYVEQLLGKGR